MPDGCCGLQRHRLPRDELLLRQLRHDGDYYYCVDVLLLPRNADGGGGGDDDGGGDVTAGSRRPPVGRRANLTI